MGLSQTFFKNSYLMQGCRSLEKLTNFQIGIVDGNCMEFMWKLTFFQTWILAKHQFGFCRYQTWFSNILFKTIVIGNLQNHTWILWYRENNTRISLFPNLDFVCFPYLDFSQSPPWKRRKPHLKHLNLPLYTCLGFYKTKFGF